MRTLDIEAISRGQVSEMAKSLGEEVAAWLGRVTKQLEEGFPRVAVMLGGAPPDLTDILPSREAIVRLDGVVLIEPHDEWAVGRCSMELELPRPH